ncbi:MAG: sulfite exporter TauE/SafE family protein [Thiotrichales bacterium]
MVNESTFLAAFLVGLLGGVHCVGMCGGIVAALSMGVHDSMKNRVIAVQSGYNLGRITSYMVAGALAGGLGALALGLTGLHELRLILQVVASVMMILLGLYIANWWGGVAQIEKLGVGLWRRLEPYSRKLIPVRSFQGALTLGLIWGWLPCGLIYSVLIWALASGSVSEGAVLMLGFGLGTLPNLVLMGIFASRLGMLLRKPWLRRLAGTVVILLAVWQFYLAFSNTRI